MADEPCICGGRYTYIHRDEGPHDAIDEHHVVVRSSSSKPFVVYASALLIPSASFSLLMLKGGSTFYLSLWSFIVSALLVKLFLRNRVERESVIIIRAFGVQLETHYKSGRKVHQFIPIDKILKPLLNECVTPVTCYWSLSLIVHGEQELVLAFKGTRPPLKILIPMWKALCAATNCPRTLDGCR